MVLFDAIRFEAIRFVAIRWAVAVRGAIKIKVMAQRGG